MENTLTSEPSKDCKHLRCDICGSRACQKHTTPIRKYGQLHACANCADRAVMFAYDAATKFFGYNEKPCGLEQRAGVGPSQLRAGKEG
jgi:hypothetical protein